MLFSARIVLVNDKYGQNSQHLKVFKKILYDLFKEIIHRIIAVIVLFIFLNRMKIFYGIFIKVEFKSILQKSKLI